MDLITVLALDITKKSLITCEFTMAPNVYVPHSMVPIIGGWFRLIDKQDVHLLLGGHITCQMQEYLSLPRSLERQPM